MINPMWSTYLAKQGGFFAKIRMGCKKFQVVSYRFDDAPNLLDAGRRLYDLSKRVPLPLKFVRPQSSDPNEQDSNLHLLVQEQPSNGRHCLIPSSVSVVRDPWTDNPECPRPEWPRPLTHFQGGAPGTTCGCPVQNCRPRTPHTRTQSPFLTWFL